MQVGKCIPPKATSLFKPSLAGIHARINSHMNNINIMSSHIHVPPYDNGQTSDISGQIGQMSCYSLACPVSFSFNGCNSQEHSYQRVENVKNLHVVYVCLGRIAGTAI